MAVTSNCNRPPERSTIQSKAKRPPRGISAVTVKLNVLHRCCADNSACGTFRRRAYVDSPELDRASEFIRPKHPPSVYLFAALLSAASTGVRAVRGRL